MTRTHLALVICAGAWGMLAGCGSSERPVTAVTIVADPGPFASVEEAASPLAHVNWADTDHRDDDASTLGFAARELQEALPGCFALPSSSVRVAPTLPDTGDAIVLKVDPTRAEAGSFRTRSTEQRGRRLITIVGQDRAGVLDGAYDLLEQLGTTFPGHDERDAAHPVEQHVVQPGAARAWPRRLDRSASPAVPIRGFWAFEPRGNFEFILWMARNRMNQWTSADTALIPWMKRLAIKLTGGGHTIQSDFLSPARYFSSHPEWYGLHGGRRSPDIRGESGDNFCTSNAEARRALAEAIASSLIDGSLRHVDVLEVWPLDMGRWCECDLCAAQGAPTDRWLTVLADVARAVRDARARGALTRAVEVSTIAYHETLPPPTRSPEGDLAGVQVTFCPYFRCYAHALADSTCTEVNRRLYRAWVGWTLWATGPRGVSLGVCEYFNVGAFKSLPLIFPHVMAADLATYTRETRLRRFEYMHAPTRMWGAWTLNHHLISRLAQNPDQNVDSLIARFARGYFPASADAMLEHLRWLEIASANILALQHCAGVYGTSAGGRLTQPEAPVFPLRHLQSKETRSATNDGPDLDEIERAVTNARAALDRARSLARDRIERARLEDESRRFIYGEAMLTFYIGLIRTAERERAGDESGARAAFASTDRAATTLRETGELIQVAASHANARDGLEASGVATTYVTFRRRYGR